MSLRVVSIFLALLAIPASTQQVNFPAKGTQKVWADRDIRPEPVPNFGNDARLQSIHHDAQELSALSSSLQLDLVQLQKGMLSKDLSDHLKKMEKLSKRLRQEVAP